MQEVLAQVINFLLDNYPLLVKLSIIGLALDCVPSFLEPFLLYLKLLRFINLNPELQKRRAVLIQHEENRPSFLRRTAAWFAPSWFSDVSKWDAAHKRLAIKLRYTEGCIGAFRTTALILFVFGAPLALWLECVPLPSIFSPGLFLPPLYHPLAYLIALDWVCGVLVVVRGFLLFWQILLFWRPLAANTCLIVTLTLLGIAIAFLLVPLISTPSPNKPPFPLEPWMR